MQNSKLLDWLERLELFLYRKAARVVSVTHSFKKDLVERGIDATKMRVVTNGVDIERFSVRAKDLDLARRLGLEGKFVAGYIGTHGMAHALETILDAAQEMQKRPDGSDVKFLLLGDGASKPALVKRSAELGLTNVVFVDSVPKELVPAYWSLLDVSIIHLKKSELFRFVIPSKLFECMAMGIPVLHGVEGEFAQIVEENQVGQTFEPQNAEELCDKLLALRADRPLYERLHVNGPIAAKRFDRRVLAMNLLEVLEDTAGPRSQKRLSSQASGSSHFR